MRLLPKLFSMDSLWGIFVGIGFSFLGTHKILTGEPSIRGGVIPAWTGWVELPFGLWVLFLSIRALWRKRHSPEEPEPPVDIDADAARAKAELDAMYLREYGTLPEPPKEEEKKKS